MASLGAKAAGLSFLTLNTAEQNAIDAGLNLYELRKVKLNNNSVIDMGLWGVDAKLWQIQGNSDGQYRLNWHRGQVAYVTYKINSKGVAVAFCPDDKEWHNRLLLCTYPETNVKIDRYHTSKGVINGAEAKKELDILSDCINDWKVVDNEDEIEGEKTLFRSKYLQEVEDQYRTMLRKNPSLKNRLQIKQSKIAKIEELMKRYGFEYFVSEEFLKEIRPAIEERIQNELYSSVESTADQLISSVANMTIDQRIELRNLLFPDEIQPESEPEPVAEPTQVTQDPITLDDLRRQAAKLNIPYKGRKKGELTEEIRTMLARKALESKPEIQTINDGPVDEYPVDDTVTEEVFN